ncbi:Emopamil-binding protein [Boletus reticuloceps]|uniref:Emopamil-binding protein n=1 Tax=Boletus reticuloceps TaxID=495285 RepID=A0A8I2YRX4_9AGAM|nr:Emopamil-binding protein [Boletus reticuloceps]
MSSPAVTLTSVVSLASIAALAVIATGGANKLLPKNVRWQDKFTFIWLAFDALIHFTLEGSFLYLSTFGRSPNTSTGFFADLWKEYALADARWGVSDPTVVSLELLTVFGAGPLCCYVLNKIMKNDPARHYWIIVLSTGELYGGWMTFCPEWLTGSPSLNISNPLHLWVYLLFMNLLWVFVPLWLMWDSYGHIAGSLRLVQALPRERID